MGLDFDHVFPRIGMGSPHDSIEHLINRLVGLRVDDVAVVEVMRLQTGWVS